MDITFICDMEEINNESNKNRIAIVVVGYNRLKSISRLLLSISNAEYNEKDIPLVISIDASGCQELYDYVNNFEWPHGHKYVNIQKERLGLKNHIFQCGDLTRFFKAIILLEDDLFVSPYFYDYVTKTVDKYGDDDRIAEISLYKNEGNGYTGLPFHPLPNGEDVFLMQDVSTWGECWTDRMWNQFKEWRDSHTEEDIQNVNMPQLIKTWERAWSKYYNAYVVETGKYVIYPYDPVTTNFSDAGEHGGDNNRLVQVHMLWGRKEYHLGDFDKLVKYDIFDNNQQLYEWLGYSKEDLCLSTYGQATITGGQRYLFSPMKYQYKIVKSYGASLRPIELNVKFGISGQTLFLYDTKEVVGNSKGNGGGYPFLFLNYFVQNYNHRLLAKELFAYYWRQLKKRIRK